MNVLLVASKYPPEYSGSGRRLHELYKRLSAMNPSIRWQVLSTRGQGAVTGWFDGVYVYRVPGARGVNQGLPKAVLRPAEILYGIRETIASLGYFQRTGCERTRIIHTCGWSWCIIAACLWGRWKGVPIIRELTSMTDHPFSPSWMRPIIRATLRWATKIVAISPFLEEKCARAGFAEKVWCRPNPVDESRFRLVSREEKISLRGRLFPDLTHDESIWLLNVGRIRPLKNQLALIHLLSRLPDPYRLILVGPLDSAQQDYLNRIQDTIRRRGLRERVIIRIGNHSNPESYMQASDLFLFPSTSEGLGTVVLEALMCGLPVISTRIRGVTDTVVENGRNGYLVDFEMEEAVEATRKASVLFDKREWIAEHARKNFGARMIDDQYRHLLERIARSLG